MLNILKISQKQHKYVTGKINVSQTPLNSTMIDQYRFLPVLARLLKLINPLFGSYHNILLLFYVSFKYNYITKAIWQT